VTRSVVGSYFIAFELPNENMLPLPDRPMTRYQSQKNRIVGPEAAGAHRSRDGRSEVSCWTARLAGVRPCGTGSSRISFVVGSGGGACARPMPSDCQRRGCRMPSGAEARSFSGAFQPARLIRVGHPGRRR
jgi:hypothetical protein